MDLPAGAKEHKRPFSDIPAHPHGVTGSRQRLALAACLKQGQSYSSTLTLASALPASLPTANLRVTGFALPT